MSTAILHPSVAAVAGQAAAHDSEPAAGSGTVIGFWIYLMSDCLLFASLFAVYAVLAGNTALGPSGKQLFDLPYVALETLVLLASSGTSGLAMLAMERGATRRVLGWLGATFVLGLVFVGMEVSEFHHLVGQGDGPGRSAFLSSYFTLVGTHGLHVASGLLWMAVMIVQVGWRGLAQGIRTRLVCLSLFWHFLDIVWICVFTLVYLMGSAA
jgi:cytochrome o ubiquinol oxidase subunit 3